MAKKKEFSTPAKKKGAEEEVPFGLDAIEQYNAENEAVEEPEEEEDVEDNEDELVLEGLSDEDDYDWDGEDDEEEETGYDFDEGAYDRREKAKQMDKEDAELLGMEDEDAELKPFSHRLEKKDIHKERGSRGEDDVEEARSEQRERAKGLTMDDYGLDDIVAKPIQNKKSKEEKMLAKMDEELDAIDFGQTEVETIKKKLTAQDLAATKQEKLARLKEESPELLNLLKDFKEKLREVNDVIAPLLEKAKKNSMPTSEGISFLETKHQLLLSYCINISFYLMLKTQGKPVKDHPVVDQLVRIRAILEKMKPIEKKLSYQIDKLVRSANLGATSGGNEELSERANPRDLEIDSEDEEVSKLGLYRAPKFSVEDEALETTDAKAKKRADRIKKLKKTGEMAQFLESKFGDRPEESTPGLAADAFEKTAQERELEELEEANFRRKDVTRADKRKLAKRYEQLNDPLAGLEEYSDMAVYDDDNGETQKDREFLKRKRMRAHMDLIDSRAKAKKRALAGADEDTYSAPKKAKPGQGLGRGFLFGDEDGDVNSDDEANERRPHFEDGEVPLPERELEEGEKRKASKRIQENRGLVRPRPKKYKTPHLRSRARAEKKVAQLGGRNKIRTQNKPYSGEKYINTNVVRSKSYDN